MYEVASVHACIGEARPYIRCKAIYEMYTPIHEMYSYAYMWDCLRCTPICKITLDVRLRVRCTPVYEVHVYV